MGTRLDIVVCSHFSPLQVTLEVRTQPVDGVPVRVNFSLYKEKNNQLVRQLFKSVFPIEVWESEYYILLREVRAAIGITQITTRPMLRTSQAAMAQFRLASSTQKPWTGQYSFEVRGPPTGDRAKFIESLRKWEVPFTEAERLTRISDILGIYGSYQAPPQRERTIIENQGENDSSKTKKKPKSKRKNSGLPAINQPKPKKNGPKTTEEKRENQQIGSWSSYGKRQAPWYK